MTAYCIELNVKCAGCGKPLKIITYNKKEDTEYFCQRCNAFDIGSDDED